MDLFKKNKPLSIAFILVLVAFVWYFVGGSISLPSLVPADQTASSPAADAAQNIAILFNRMASASINTSFFSSQAWTSLNDVSAPLPNDPSGKDDLFAPIGIGRASQVSGVQTQTQAQIPSQNQTNRVLPTH